MSTFLNIPALVVHADWGTDPRKRWMARARLVGGAYRLSASEPVPDAGHLLETLRHEAGTIACVIAGFDFPIGVPEAYSRRAGITDFVDLLPQLGEGRWARFYDVAEHPDEITLTRPFYPRGTSGVKQHFLLEGLGLRSIDDLRRRCERKTANRPAACPLFWTLGGNQVGKGAIAGWREVLVPALREQGDVKIWPFAGPLHELIRTGHTVIVETYPAEAYRQVGVTFPPPRAGVRSGKRVQGDRRANADVLLHWAEKAGVQLDPKLRDELLDGFGAAADGEDRFDAVLGLVGMLEVVLGRRAEGAPDQDAVQHLEGWILGQAS